MGEANLGSPREVISIFLKNLESESILKLGKISIKMCPYLFKQIFK
jgi:hypothetical protein